MLDIAEKIIAQQEGKFDPSHFKDRYEDALRELIERKKKGKPIEAEEPKEKGDNVIDLMAALKNSLKGAGGSRRPHAKRAKTARERAA
jgi:DNA end-binding protein Ku